VLMSRGERREGEGQEGNTCRGYESWSDGERGCDTLQVDNLKKCQTPKENNNNNVTTTHGDYIYKPVNMPSMPWTTKRKP
jgi:hypothetical protein